MWRPWSTRTSASQCGMWEDRTRCAPCLHFLRTRHKSMHHSHAKVKRGCCCAPARCLLLTTGERQAQQQSKPDHSGCGRSVPSGGTTSRTHRVSSSWWTATIAIVSAKPGTSCTGCSMRCALTSIFERHLLANVPQWPSLAPQLEHMLALEDARLVHCCIFTVSSLHMLAEASLQGCFAGGALLCKLHLQQQPQLQHMQASNATAAAAAALEYRRQSTDFLIKASCALWLKPCWPCRRSCVTQSCWCLPTSRICQTP